MASGRQSLLSIGGRATSETVATSAATTALKSAAVATSDHQPHVLHHLRASCPQPLCPLPPCYPAPLVSCLQDYSVLDKLSTVHCVTLKGVSAATGHCCKFPLPLQRRGGGGEGALPCPQRMRNKLIMAGMAIPQVAIKCSARTLTLLRIRGSLRPPGFSRLPPLWIPKCPMRLPDFQFQFWR